MEKANGASQCAIAFDYRRTRQWRRFGFGLRQWCANEKS
jgi:hypothetical protein